MLYKEHVQPIIFASKIQPVNWQLENLKTLKKYIHFSSNVLIQAFNLTAIQSRVAYQH